MRFRRLRSFAVWSLCLTTAVNAQVDPNAVMNEQDATAISVEARRNSLNDLIDVAKQLRDAGENLQAAGVLNRAGRFQLLLNQPDEAILTYRSALRALEENSDPRTTVDTLTGLATAYNHASKCDLAKPLLDRAIELSGQNSYTEGKAEALLVQSSCVNFEDHESALASALESLQLWQSTTHKSGMARAYAAIGEYLMLKDVLASSENFEKAKKLWEELNNQSQVAQILINLGFIEYRKGAWQACLSLFVQAQQLIDEKAEPYMMGQIMSGLAEAFLESGLPEAGLEKYRDARAYYIQAQNPRARMSTEWGMGKTHYLMGKYSEALATLSSTRAEAEAIKEGMLIAHCDDFLGRTYFAMNDYPAALRHYRAAVDGYTRTKNPVEVSRTLALMGQVYEQQGELAKAKKNYQTALASFRSLTDHVNESATLYALGALELKENHVDEAAEHLRESIALTEKMRRVSTSVDLTAAFSARVYDRYQKYIDCLMRKSKTSGSEAHLITAFETSELSRARSLTELLRATKANLFTGIDPDLARREKQVRESMQINENAKVTLLSGKYAKKQLEALQADYNRLEREHQLVLEEIRVKNPAYEQVINPAAWSLRQIQEQILVDDQTVLLEYSLGSERSYLWAVTRSAIKSYELPKESQIVEVADRVHHLLAVAPSRTVEQELNQSVTALAQMILSPVQDQLHHQRILVVADGVLNYIPFQILPSTTDEPLVSNSEIINAPSASILGELQREATQRRPAAKTLAAFGDPVFASNYNLAEVANESEELIAGARWRSARSDIGQAEISDRSPATRLFYAKRELQSLREVVGDSCTIVSDYDANRQQFLHADLTQYDVLHLVTHGYFNPARPENSGFALSTIDQNQKRLEGFVELKDIYGLRVPVKLVVLSACQTALGKDVRGEGLLGLTRGFMYAGASSVVASLWQVDDAATTELMQLFYTNMLEHGMRPSEALRTAQNSIRQQKHWRSPYYWAAFTLQGDYRQVIKPGPVASGFTLRWKMLAGVTLLLVLVGPVWWYRRRRLTARAS